MCESMSADVVVCKYIGADPQSAFLIGTGPLTAQS